MLIFEQFSADDKMLEVSEKFGKMLNNLKLRSQGLDPDYKLPNVDLTGCVAIVTGSNTGIGKETARGLAVRGAKVILACRNVEKAEEAAKDIAPGSINVKVKKCDLSSFASVREFCRQINKEERRVDFIINNAGVFVFQRTLTEDGQELQFQTNHLGHFLLTNLLMDKLKASKKGARIINVASVAHRVVFSFPWSDVTMADSWYNGAHVYGVTKLSNVWFTTELARRLKGTGVQAFSLHPGGVSTDLGRYIGDKLPEFISKTAGKISELTMLSSEEGAMTTLFCALEPELSKPEYSGKYFDACREGILSTMAQNEEMAGRLWELSNDIVQLEN